MSVSKNRPVCLLLSPSTRGSVLCDRKHQGCLFALLQASSIATQSLLLSPKVAEIKEHGSHIGSHASSSTAPEAELSCCLTAGRDMWFHLNVILLYLNY